MIFYSTSPDVVLPEIDVFAYMESNPCNVPGDHLVFIDSVTNDGLTFQEYIDRSKMFAAMLQDNYDFKPDQVLAILSPNQHDFGIPVLGTLAAGGVVTTLNHSYTVSEIAFQLSDSNAQFIVTTAAMLPSALTAAKICGITTDRILLFGGKKEGQEQEQEQEQQQEEQEQEQKQQQQQQQQQQHSNDITTTTPVAARYYTHLMPTGSRLATPVTRSLSDLAYLCYSSGTTGKSKGVMLSHGNITANIRQIMDYDTKVIANREQAVVLGFLPFYHVYGLVNIFHLSLIAGMTTVVMSKFDLISFLKCIQDYKVTNLFVVPPVALAMAKHPVVDQFDLSSLSQICCGAAPLPKDLCDMILNRLGVQVRQGFGMTEASPLVACLRPGQVAHGSVGPLVCNLRAKVIDVNTGKELGVGEEGEWMLKGPNVMQGYLNNPEATAATLTEDGWMHTGDIAKVDENGLWYIVDRLKELIKYKGFQCPPSELEAVILTHPHILDCCVIPVYDVNQATELPRAYVVVHPVAKDLDQEEIKKDLMDFVASKVANHKKLRGGVVFTNEIPKTASGKILRKDVIAFDRAQAAAAVAASKEE